MIAGHENHLSLTSTGTACIQNITLDTAAGKRLDTQWKHDDGTGSVDVAISLKSLDPGDLHLSIQQFAESKPDSVAAQTFSEPARLTSLDLHAGDTTASLTGTSLDQVQQLSLGSLTFAPAPQPSGTSAELSTAASDPSTTLRLTLLR